MTSETITFLTNWQAVPYHLPIFRAQSQVRRRNESGLSARTRDDLLAHHLNFILTSAHLQGYFADAGIKVAILEPNDPSDVVSID